MEKEESLRRYTELEKEELMEQWKQSGKSKAVFCKEQSVGYYSFCAWVKRRKDKALKGKSSFVPVQIKATHPEGIFVKVVLKNGTTLSFYHYVESYYLAVLFRS